MLQEQKHTYNDQSLDGVGVYTPVHLRNLNLIHFWL